ncbi:MAG: 3-dehydroquinate synthase [Cytophagaceae bacterium]|jgi:3-dehydroquinate synthase|nr:3-dehydroquinate synthase [Cytophagaceae bacterium]
MQHEVRVGNSIETFLSEFLQAHRYSKLAVLCDENTYQHCFPRIRPLLPSGTLLMQIPSGEEAKTLDSCQRIWEFMTHAGLDRKALLINLGGGVIGDMGGFCASTYKRGIDFIQLPTTLLSQVDASVGGKLGIDFSTPGNQIYKNHIGVFNQPQTVLIDTTFLQTLSPRELRSGFAEVIKHCLIADGEKWNQIKTQDFKSLDWPDIVQHSVDIKKQITTADPHEKGLRKILNFGHTLGHAVESFFLPTKRKLLHGEAIAVGMISEAYLAMKLGYIQPEELGEISSYILRVYDKVEIKDSEIKKIIPLTRQDKKNENDLVLFSLLEKVGKANFNIALDDEQMEDGLHYYQCL